MKQQHQHQQREQPTKPAAPIVVAQETRGYHRIKRLRVIGGFLDGINVTFCNSLNCLIGPRGTGKTTIVELIRFGLDAMPGREGDPLRKRIESLVGTNLDGGRVETVVETKDGLTYTITRTSGDAPIVLDEDGKPVAGLKMRGGVLFQADIFSQNQMESIAEMPHYQLDLIDKFREEELGAVCWDIGDIQHNLKTNATELLPRLTKKHELESELKELPVIEAKLSGYKQTAGSNADSINDGHAEKALRDRELRVIDETAKVMAHIGQTIKGMTGLLDCEARSLFTGEMLSGRNASLLEKLCGSIKRAANETDLKLGEVLDTLRDAHRTLLAGKATLEEAHKVQELAFLKLVEKHKEAQTKSVERAKLDKRRNELLFKKREIADIAKQIETLNNSRDILLKHLTEKLDQRFALRSAVAKQLSAELSGNIRVRVVQCGNREEYRKHLEAALRTPSMKTGVVAGRISDALSPSELVELVKQSDPDILAERCGLNDNQACSVIDRLNDPEKLFQLEAVILEDAPCIELIDRGEPKESAVLSTGQKCTAILPILLFDSVNPLLVDQPEDNLDNSYIYETVVENVRKAKQSRQLIFVTHNPNIPVLGDAAQVVVMDSDGRKATVIKSGNVDTCKEDIVTLLEGGEEAFKARKLRYNY